MSEMTAQPEQPRPWEQCQGEPSRWFTRFHDIYLMLGPDRSIDEAWRRYAKAQGKVLATPRQKRAPREWSTAALKWKWAERARSFDAHARAQIRRKHLKQVEVAQRRHRILMDKVFDKLMKQFPHVSWDKVTSPTQFLRLLNQAVDKQRLILQMPMTAEQVQLQFGVKTEPASDDMQQAIEQGSSDIPDELLSDERYARILSIMKIHGAFDGEPDDTVKQENRPNVEEPAA